MEKVEVALHLLNCANIIPSPSQEMIPSFDEARQVCSVIYGLIIYHISCFKNFGHVSPQILACLLGFHHPQFDFHAYFPDGVAKIKHQQS